MRCVLLFIPKRNKGEKERKKRISKERCFLWYIYRFVIILCKVFLLYFESSTLWPLICPLIYYLATVFRTEWLRLCCLWLPLLLAHWLSMSSLIRIFDVVVSLSIMRDSTPKVLCFHVDNIFVCFSTSYINELGLSLSLSLSLSFSVHIYLDGYV